MLTENKFGKYLIYAVGEIILVVIGILIALSINNWNQNQIEKKTINSYLKKIESNIQQDLKVSQRMLDFRVNTSANCKEASRMLLDRDFSKQEIIQDAIFGMVIEFQMNYNRPAFESLKSSGSLSKIDDYDLEDLIYNYYSLVDDVVDAENDVQNWSNELELELDKNGFMVKFIQLDSKVFPTAGEQISLYDDALCEHIGHGIILNILMRGGLDFASNIKKQIKAGEELSLAIGDYIDRN